MSKEELVSKYADLIYEKLTHGNGELTDNLLKIIEESWKAGYEFRIQEEELNKGASF